MLKYIKDMFEQHKNDSVFKILWKKS